MLPLVQKMMARFCSIGDSRKQAFCFFQGHNGGHEDVQQHVVMTWLNGAGSLMSTRSVQENSAADIQVAADIHVAADMPHS